MEKEILADIEVDQSSKSKRREFREKIQERADRRKQRQEEKGRVQKESRAKKEDRKKQKESQRFAVTWFHLVSCFGSFRGYRGGLDVSPHETAPQACWAILCRVGLWFPRSKLCTQDTTEILP